MSKNQVNVPAWVIFALCGLLLVALSAFFFFHMFWLGHSYGKEWWIFPAIVTEILMTVFCGGVGVLFLTAAIKGEDSE